MRIVVWACMGQEPQVVGVVREEGRRGGGGGVWCVCPFHLWGGGRQVSHGGAGMVGEMSRLLGGEEMVW